MKSKSSLGRLEFCNFKLETLLEFTLAINQNKSTDELMQMYEELLTKSLNIGKVLVFARNHGWNVILASGTGNEVHQEIKVEHDLMPYEEEDIMSVQVSDNKKLNEFDYLLRITHNQKPIAFVLIGDIDEEQTGVSPVIKHMQFIRTLSNIIIVAIENKRLFKENLKRERIHKEMELASEVQKMLVPDISKFRHNEFVGVRGFYLPHFEIGGDYYDVLPLSSHEIGFCIADVSGKGISAALLMSNFQANLRALFSSSLYLTDIVGILNERVIESVKGERFITLFIARYDYDTKILKYINAGHNPPILYNKETKELTYLESGCVGMGMVDNIEIIEEGQIEITGNSKLLCYTDGLVEVRCEDQEVGSTSESVEKCVSNNLPIDETIEKIINKLNINKSNKSIFDDITMLGLDFYYQR